MGITGMQVQKFNSCLKGGTAVDCMEAGTTMHIWETNSLSPQDDVYPKNTQGSWQPTLPSCTASGWRERCGVKSAPQAMHVDTAHYLIQGIFFPIGLHRNIFLICIKVSYALIQLSALLFCVTLPCYVPCVRLTFLALSPNPHPHHFHLLLYEWISSTISLPLTTFGFKKAVLLRCSEQ